MRKTSVILETLAATTAACAAAIAGAAHVSAQTVDYGALEQLFGEPVTTSATGQPQRSSAAPANMVIITAEDIRRSGATDLPGVLRHVGGVDIMQWTAGDTEVSVRGYNREFASRLLVLIDGRQVYADHHGFTPWHMLPVELAEIRQIEVVRGPNSALFGFNAIGGVVNIITYDPERDDIDAAEATAGTQQTLQGALINTFRLSERASMRVSLGSRTSEEFDTPVPDAFGGDFRDEDIDRDAVSVDGVVRMTDRVRLRVNASHVESSRNEVVTALSLNGAAGTTSSVLASLTADTSTGLWQARAYTNKIDVASVPTPSLPDPFVFENRVTVAQLEDLFTIGSAHTLRAAAEYRRNSVNTTPFAGGEIAYDVYSVSGMWSWRITPSLSLTNAVRLDRLELERTGVEPPGFGLTNAAWDRRIDETSFNTGVVWRASERDTFRALVSRGVQLPNLSFLGAVTIVNPFVGVAGSPDLAPTSAMNYELVWDRDLDWIDARLRASVFHQNNADLTSVEGAVYPGPRVYVGPSAVGGSHATGIEIGLDGSFADAWRWRLDYRGEAVDDDFTQLDGARAISTNYEDTTPEHLVHASLGWSGGRWEVDSFARYQSDVHGLRRAPPGGSPPLTRIEDHAALDGRVAYQLNEHATFAVSGQNLATSEQRQTSGPKVERRVMGTLTFNY